MSGWLLSVGVALLSTPVLAQVGSPCSATVEVTGDMALAQDISGMLSQRGIPPPAQPSLDGCAPVRARVHERAGMLEVQIDDGQGRRQERRVGSMDAAAALIESWARIDVPDPLLSRPPRPVRAPLQVSPPPLVDSDEPFAPNPAFSLALAVDIALSNDGGRWGGVMFSGCAYYGPVCALLTARWSTSTLRSANPEYRTELSALAGVRLPLVWGPLTVAPSLSVGAGWMQAKRDAFTLGRECAHAPEPTCTSSEIPAATANATSLRTEAAVLLSLSPAENVGVDFTLGGSFAPLARNHLQPEEEEARKSEIPLQGEPRWTLHSALGLHWSGP